MQFSSNYKTCLRKKKTTFAINLALRKGVLLLISVELRFHPGDLSFLSMIKEEENVTLLCIAVNDTYPNLSWH